MNLTSETLQSLIRHFFTFGAGILAVYGYEDGGALAQISAGLCGLVAGGWSIYNKVQTKKEVEYLTSALRYRLNH